MYTRDIPDPTDPGDCDLLQVLWCPFEAHGPDHTIDVVLTWRRSQDVAEALADIPEPVVVGRKECVPHPRVLGPEQVVEHEYVGLLDPELQEGIELWEEERLDAEDASDGPGSYDSYEEYEAAMGGGEPEGDELTYRHDLFIPPGWKVGGFASWHLTDPAPVVSGACRPCPRLSRSGCRPPPMGNGKHPPSR
ncbi:hypothetical protein AB0A94_09070 [Streptomyces sp. NPDC044984]|uniref:hypothetical protein n=1 Tax=Streptomyces sp. NPDC044984 TaxID=3154335 RepID=UPI0033FD86AB